jgi:hypothetical protein
MNMLTKTINVQCIYIYTGRSFSPYLYFFFTVT